MIKERTIETPLAVLIVGVGPTGLTLACELARRGVSFRLIEAVPARRPDPAAKAFSRAL